MPITMVSGRDCPICGRADYHLHLRKMRVVGTLRVPETAAPPGANAQPAALGHSSPARGKRAGKIILIPDQDALF